MNSAPIQFNPDPIFNQPAARPQPIQRNTAEQPAFPPALPYEHARPQRQDTPPQMNPTNAPADPRGTKRSIDEVESSGTLEDTNEPQFKRVRTEPQQVDPKIQSLFEAIARGDGELVQSLLKQAPELRGVYHPGANGQTPLCFAAQRGDIALVGQLLALREPVDAAARNGSTPLMYAAQAGQAECVRLLCESGANPNMFNPTSHKTPLCFAIEQKNLEICKLLMSLGADLFLLEKLAFPSNRRKSWAPFITAVFKDFSPLIGWLLDTQRLTPDSTIPFTTQCTLLTYSAGQGAVSIVKLLLERGANPLIPFETANGEKFSGALDSAEKNNKFHVIECLLRFRQASGKDESAWPVEKDLKKMVSIDLYRHLDLWAAPTKRSNNGLRTATGRDNLRSMLEKMARDDCMTEAGCLVWKEMVTDGWSAHFLPTNNQLIVYSVCVKILEKNAFKRPLDRAERSSSAAQQLQMLIESLSIRCGLPAPFSSLKLTPQTEQVMNEMFDLQRNLVLDVIADFRVEFAEQVRKLPHECINVFISRTNQLNEGDLYRMLTGEWGLYDPVARAVVRLVREAWDKLQQARKKELPAEFSAQTESEQLRHVIEALLEEWDKIPEIAEAIRQGKTDDEVESLADLLFQQWRLFGEAFGVTKPRAVRFGPHKPEDSKAESVMAMDRRDAENTFEFHYGDQGSSQVANATASQ